MAGKARHRWSKEFAEEQFHIDYAGSTATVIWEKAKQMRILAGAKMLPDSDAPLLKDGSAGFVARVAASFRAEHADAYDPKTWRTTKDILLRSPNEVGNFLYFAGTNTWQQLKNVKGQTLDELSAY